MATDEVPKIQGASVSRTTTFMKFHNAMYMYCNLYTLQAIGVNDPSLSLVTVHVYVFHLIFFIRQMRRPNPAFYNCCVVFSLPHRGLLNATGYSVSTFH